MRQDSKTAAITVSSAAMSSQGLKVHRPLKSLDAMSCTVAPINIHKPGQITIIPKPELRGFWGDSLTKLPFGVTSAEVAINCPDKPNFTLFNSSCKWMQL